MTLSLILLTMLILAATAQAGDRSDVARQLNYELAGTPMARTGYLLEAAGWRYRINPALIAAIAGTESSFGSASCRGNPYNAFGLASCGNSWHVPYFPTWKSAYLFMGAFLTERWPRARTPWDYHGYAACSSCWGDRVAYFMRRLGFAAGTRYPT